MFCINCLKEIPEDSVFCLYCGKKQVKKKIQRVRGNGEGSVYKTSNGTWRVEVTLGYKSDGKRISRSKSGFKTKKEALEYISVLKHSPPQKKTTLNDLWETYLITGFKKLSASKQTHYRTAANRLEDIFFIDIKLLSIGDLQDQIDSKVSTYYPARDMKTLLSALYTMAEAQELVRTNLSSFIVLPPLEETVPEPFNENEILAFWHGWDDGDVMCGYILLMIYSGMMPGELFRVTKNMIDFKAQTIVGAGLKTKKRKQTPIVLADVIIPVVEKLCAQSNSLMLINMSRDKFYEEYKKATERCQVRPLRPYSCRHTTATALSLLNTSTPIIKEIMRHSKITTTQRYVHIDVEPMLKAINNL